MPKEDSKGDNSFGVASVILGILAVLFSILPIYGIVLGIIGIVFACLQRKRANNKWALWGLILSIAGIVMSILIYVWLVYFIQQVAQQMQQLQSSGALEGSTASII
jgi:heme/copper-type cytochrome/quinol oxidase subunit 2